MGSYDVFFGGSAEGSLLVELLGVDGGDEIGASYRMSDFKKDGKFQVYPLGEQTFGSESRGEVSFYIGILYGEVYRKIQGSALGESLGVESGTYVCSSFDLSDGCVEKKIRALQGNIKGVIQCLAG